MINFKQYLKEAIVDNPDNITELIGAKVIKLVFSLDYSPHDSDAESPLKIPNVDGCDIYFDNGKRTFVHCNYWDDKTKVLDLMKKGKVVITDNSKNYYDKDTLKTMDTGGKDYYIWKRGNLTIEL